eukprot:2115809-Prymnesium_polylepis.1
MRRREIALRAIRIRAASPPRRRARRHARSLGAVALDDNVPTPEILRTRTLRDIPTNVQTPVPSGCVRMQISRRDGCDGARSPCASAWGEHPATRSRAAAVTSPPFTGRPARRP